MEIIFLKDVKGIAQAGEVKKVSDGFALNFLLPQGLAETVTAVRLKKLADLKNKKIKTDNRRVNDLLNLTNRINNQVVIINSRASSAGTLYAAIDVGKIIKAIGKRFRVAVPATALQLSQPIKKIGEYKISLQLMESGIANFIIKVENNNGQD